MTGLTVEPEDGETIVLGKPVSNLQKDVVVGDDTITGSLYRVTGYTGYSEDTEKQSGYYLALHVDTGDATDVETAVEMIRGEASEAAVMDENGAAVMRYSSGGSAAIAASAVKVTATRGEETAAKTYTLNIGFMPD